MTDGNRCSRCGAEESVVALTHLEGDLPTKVHLCARCAAEKGIQTPAAAAEHPLSGLLATLGSGVGPPQAPLVPETPCPGCGGTLQDFRESGRLGCGQCYATFGEPLRELLRRLHGSAHHTGRGYHAPGTEATVPSPQQITELRHRLRQAIEDEQFEKAAELRDRLKEWE